MIHEDIEALVSSDTASLFASLGRQLGPNTLAIAEDSDGHLEHDGRYWLNRNRSKLAKQICGTQVMRLVSQDTRTMDRVLLVAAVADLISSVVTGVAATTVAVLLVREGLVALCGEHKQDSDDQAAESIRS